MQGKYRDQFLVDWYQGGAGTSANMNANEVLANAGLELMGHKKGEYPFLEPHDDLNMAQSTNDSYPTAIKVAFLLRQDKLVAELQQLVAAFRATSVAVNSSVTVNGCSSIWSSLNARRVNEILRSK